MSFFLCGIKPLFHVAEGTCGFEPQSPYLIDKNAIDPAASQVLRAIQCESKHIQIAQRKPGSRGATAFFAKSLIAFYRGDT